MTIWQRVVYLFISFIVVAYGQPAWYPPLGLLAACIGFATCWRALIDLPSPKIRFLVGMGWYAAVQIVQLSWFVSHPYGYIYALLLVLAGLWGAQWGCLTIWITPKVLERPLFLFSLAGFWTLCEWSRLFLLSGFPFNPVGLSLSGSLYSLQAAAVGGIYGLSFWVIWTNLLVLRAWMAPQLTMRWGSAVLSILLPYGFGWVHLGWHQPATAEEESDTLSVALVQSASPIEEKMTFQSAEEIRQFVLKEWRSILSTLQKQRGKSLDLIVLPENVVPYGAYHRVFWLGEVRQLFQELFDTLPEGFPEPVWDNQERVSNAFVAQALADVFHAHIVIGLEDSLYDEGGRRAESYSAAFHFHPGGKGQAARYEKRILVPMGEYIPFSCCRELAARYGVTGSFTPGQGVKIFEGPIPLGASICYEEIYGHLMRENRIEGARLLVNLTNDGWYPSSRLPKQHFDHARLRSVENGIPLVRACNTGVTGGVDSLGRIVGVLGEDHMQVQELADSIQLDMPLYHYRTLYARYGDWPVLSLACVALLMGIADKRRHSDLL